MGRNFSIVHTPTVCPLDIVGCRPSTLLRVWRVRVFRVLRTDLGPPVSHVGRPSLTREIYVFESSRRPSSSVDVRSVTSRVR